MYVHYPFKRTSVVLICSCFQANREIGAEISISYTILVSVMQCEEVSFDVK